jgi:hypothetical protein
MAVLPQRAQYGISKELTNYWEQTQQFYICRAAKIIFAFQKKRKKI